MPIDSVMWDGVQRTVQRLQMEATPPP